MISAPKAARISLAKIFKAVRFQIPDTCQASESLLPQKDKGGPKLWAASASIVCGDLKLRAVQRSCPPSATPCL